MSPQAKARVASYNFPKQHIFLPEGRIMSNPRKSRVFRCGPDEKLAMRHFRPRIVFAANDASEATRRTSKRSRILIVEDDFLVALQMESALAGAGFDVAGVAHSAEDALELAAVHRPALIVMDIRLSGRRDGIDAALALYATHGVRCVFASAHQTAEARARAQPANPLAWLAKPYTMQSLVETVRQALGSLRLEDQ
jgi:two-component system, response regulator PdtaR